MTSFQNYQMEREEEKSKFTVEKPGKDYLSQVIKANINSLSHVDSMYLWHDSMNKALYLSEPTKPV